MAERAEPRGALRPEAWRSDLLRLVLRWSSVLGSIVCGPSVVAAVASHALGVAILDAVSLASVLALTFVKSIPERVRAGGTCLLFYVLGAGLMAGIGAIGQVFLLGFSILTMLLVSARWGQATVALNGVTMLVTGYLGLNPSPMFAPHDTAALTGWVVVTINFLLVNSSLLLAIGAVIVALERALHRTVTARAELEREQRELVNLNHSLELEVRERARTEQSLRENKALLRIAGQTARIGGWRLELATDTLEWSDEVCDLYEVSAGTSPDLPAVLAFFVPEYRDTVVAAIERCAKLGEPVHVEAEIVTAKGNRLWISSIGNAIRDASGAITHLHGSAQDITPQKAAEARHAKLEEQFRQSQKMETLGSLAGGVAHDMNNLMSVVVSYSELLAEEMPPGNPARADLDEIQAAGRRAIDLTRQLLAFSRQQVLAPKVVSLAGIVQGMENMLRRLIGEDVDLATSCAPGTVLVDPGQIEQVIMNLVVNARDAMPRGGMITIETAETTLDDAYAAEHEGVSPGPHMMLAVSDTGTGIDRATRERMFEPFFTTKEQGKGTGLGLATVFGIVRQSGGTIGVYSELGTGTTFKVYFPIADGDARRSLAPAADRSTLHGNETILLVEDEESVRVLARTILRKQGYRVIEAQNGGEALLLCEQYAAPIDLLLTDVVMPRTSGRELAERLQPLRPSMKVLFMSGYTDDAVVRHGILDSTIAFLPKPITPESLARKVREVLDDAAT